MRVFELNTLREDLEISLFTNKQTKQKTMFTEEEEPENENIQLPFCAKPL